MAYEIDFIGVGSESKKDADAICLRWLDGDSYKIAVYDGGFQAHGEEMVRHLNEYYFDDPEGDKKREDKIVDCVIISHPDQDHVSGIKNIIENFSVERLYMNRPWLYLDELYEKINDGRITKKSLESRLKNAFSNIAEIESLAQDYDVDILEIFEGELICNKFLTLSPSRDFYLKLLVESNKTPLEESSNLLNFALKSFRTVANYVKNLLETWSNEQLREDVSTSAENETSVVILGQDDEYFLLTADAGIRALRNAIDYACKQNYSLKDIVKFYQVPHHGGRHNISPSILNDLIGEILPENEKNDKTAFVSVAKDSDHPLQMVVNAFIRRGVTIYKTNGATIRHKINMPTRYGWSSVTALAFDENVEDWDE